MVQHSFSAPHAVADAKFDVFAAEMTFGLIDGSELINYTVADVQSVDPVDFNIDSNVHFLQPPDLMDGFQCVPAKAAEGLYQNQIYFFLVQSFRSCW